MASQYRRPHLYQAVDYSQVLDSDLQLIPVAKEDISQLEQRVSLLPLLLHKSDWKVYSHYSSAQLTQDLAV